MCRPSPKVFTVHETGATPDIIECGEGEEAAEDA
jgi:hypothetical protein